MSNYKTDKPEQLTEQFKALANPHRLQLFLTLSRCCTPGSCCPDSWKQCVGTLGKEVNLAPSTVSHHLKELRRAGLIYMERQGREVACWANPEAIKKLADFFSALKST